MNSTPTALLFVNEESREGAEHIANIRHLLKLAEFNLIEPETSVGEDIPRQILSQKNSADLVILGGGDGTLHLALPALIESGLPFAILPLGTANDLARTLSIPFNINQAIDVIINSWQNQTLFPLDVGLVNDEPFFNVANMGLATEVTRKLDKHLKRRWGVFGYLIACYRAVKSARSFVVKLTVDGTQHTFKSVQLSVGNGRHYGGGMIIRDDATIDDGRLDVYSLRPQSFFMLLLVFPLMRLGIQRRLRRVDEFTGKTVHVSTSRPLRMTADGEFCEHTPATFILKPAAVRVLAPVSYTQVRAEQAQVFD